MICVQPILGCIAWEPSFTAPSRPGCRHLAQRRTLQPAAKWVRLLGNTGRVRGKPSRRTSLPLMTRCGSAMPSDSPPSGHASIWTCSAFHPLRQLRSRGASMRQEVATRMVKSLILAFILLFAARLENAHACMGPHQRTFPTCEISAPRSDERTTIVYANSGNALSSVTLGSDVMVTEVVDIEIGVADKPHYIAL